MALRPPARLDALRRALCPGNETLYAVLDTAIDDTLYPRLQEEPETSQARCLYDGDAAVRYARYAPYLLRLHADSPLTRQWMAHGWPAHWGIFCAASSPPDALKRHFKRFLSQSHQGKTVWLRFYDPRVLPKLLAELPNGARSDFFGQTLIRHFGAPSGEHTLWKASAHSEGWLQRAVNAAQLHTQTLTLP